MRLRIVYMYLLLIVLERALNKQSSIECLTRKTLILQPSFINPSNIIPWMLVTACTGNKPDYLTTPKRTASGRKNPSSKPRKPSSQAVTTFTKFKKSPTGAEWLHQGLSIAPASMWQTLMENITVQENKTTIYYLLYRLVLIYNPSRLSFLPACCASCTVGKISLHSLSRWTRMFPHPTSTELSLIVFRIFVWAVNDFLKDSIAKSFGG